MEIMATLISALPPEVIATIQGGIVSMLVSALARAAGPGLWRKVSPAAKVGLVALVAALWAIGAGLIGGLGLGAAAATGLSALVSALGVRQVVKLARPRGGPSVGRGLSLRTSAPV